MIYLIKVTYYEEETNMVLPLLKIGYAGDVDDRMKSYWTTNPKAKLIDTREGGYDVEGYLHTLFRNYRYIGEHSREWFYYDQSIIDEFHTEINTEPIDCNALVATIYNIYPLIKRTTVSELNRVRNLEEIIKILEQSFNKTLSEDEIDKIFETYSNMKDEFEEIKRKIEYDTNYKNASNIIDDFMKNSFTTTGIFEHKLKYFCEFMDIYKDNLYIRDQIRYKIPDLRYHNFYLFFGTGRCRALKWKAINLFRALEDALNTDKVMASVKNTFEVGKRYTKKELKYQVGEIYRVLGISSNPKATDIKKWFETKPVIIADPITKQKENGFELLSRKDSISL